MRGIRKEGDRTESHSKHICQDGSVSRYSADGSFPSSQRMISMKFPSGSLA